MPYLFATCRFAHYLKCIVRDKVGSFKEREDMEKWLNRWIGNYIVQNPKTATEEEKARKPLSAAQVEVVADDANPGYYSSKIFLRPHYQLEGLTVSLRLVSENCLRLKAASCPYFRLPSALISLPGLTIDSPGVMMRTQ